MSSSEIDQSAQYSDSYYLEESSSLNIPSSPIFSASHKRKRSDDLNSMQVLQPQETPGKRNQIHKIHSQAHINTIDLLMKSQRILQEQERMQKVMGVEDHTQAEFEEAPMKESFQQRPFWPAVNKLAHLGN